MNPTIDDGGPAFPVTETIYEGMSLRDYFAANADIPWEAVFNALEQKFPHKAGKLTNSEIVEYRACLKYLEADAMLKARNEPTQPTSQPPAAS